MGSFADFAQTVRRVNFEPGGLLEAEASEAFANFARQEVAKVIARGEGSEVYDLYIGGRPANSESDSVLPESILYVFSWWQELIELALRELIKRSPRKSGLYAKSFVVLVNGSVVNPAAEIAPGAEVIITNVQPYTRKIQVGAMEMNVPPRLFDNARQAMYRKVGGRRAAMNIEVKFLQLSPGVHPLVPYRLKGGGSRAGARTLLASAYRNGRKFLSRRKDRAPGALLTYPALVMNMDS